MKIAIASDHRGFEFKQKISGILSQSGHTIVDFGTNNSNSSVDYPDYGSKAAKAVAQGQCDRAILICGTGIGMSMAANKIKGIRATVGNDLFSAEMSRRHNDSNVLCLGAELIPPGSLALKIVQLWLNTPFEGERHAKRVAKIMELENNK
ncbi:MAG: ribose 5-phosphate isomerase B [Candidatus Brocadiales bacterium]|nr:ribose 5-phosphate isomerase B [Candidatus Brocadiales bacterium]